MKLICIDGIAIFVKQLLMIHKGELISIVSMIVVSMADCPTLNLLV